MEIKAFKIGCSEHFKLGDNFFEVKDKVEKAGYDTELEEKNGLKLLSMTYNNLFLIFDTNNELVGFANDCVDGSSEYEIGITFIDENDNSELITICDFSNILTTDIVDLNMHKKKHPEIDLLEGFVHYGTYIDSNNKKYLVQATEMFDYEETVVIIREDLADKLPILYTVSIGFGVMPDAELTEVNLTELIYEEH